MFSSEGMISDRRGGCHLRLQKRLRELCAPGVGRMVVASVELNQLVVGKVRYGLGLAARVVLVGGLRKEIRMQRLVEDRVSLGL